MYSIKLLRADGKLGVFQGILNKLKYILDILPENNTLFTNITVESDYY